MTEEIKAIQNFIEESRLVRKEIIESLLEKLTKINLTLASTPIHGGG